VTAAVAALPLAIVLAAMGWAHLSAARAGAIGLAVALAIVVVVFAPHQGGTVLTLPARGRRR
jgi:L-lactate permease